jgi:ribosome biogenesis protein NSA1
MRLITGDECGLLKEVMPELGRKKKNPKSVAQPRSAMIDVTREGISRVDPKESQKRDRGVVDMIWMHEGDDSTDDQASSSSFGVLRKNGSVDLWSANIDKKSSFGQYSLSRSTPDNIFGTNDRPRPLGLEFFSQQNRLCAGDMLGNIVVLDCNENKCDVVQTYNSYTANKGGSTISYTPGKLQNIQLATALAFDTVRGRAAVGGREREVCLTDISTGKLVFKTKNKPPDPQTLLQQPVWPTAIQFLNQESNIMAVGTAYKQVRLYDVRESSKTRRPTSLTPEGLFDYRITCLCQIDDNELVVGDASGDIHTIDLRRLGQNSKGPANRDLARYAGPAGSVRQLKKHPTLPRLTAVGLDRMLRVYDTNTRKQLDCVYLKQRLNCVLFHKNNNWDSDDTGVISDDDFDKMDDFDIDQDDVVEDYVDSDASDNENNNIKSEREAEEASESDSEENNSADKSLDDDDDDSSGIHKSDSEGESSDGDSEDESSDEVGSGEESKNESEEKSEDEEETIIISQKTKRRRRN